MSKRSRPDGPCRTKATYDDKRPRFDPPCPGKIAAADALLKAECAESRKASQEVTRAGGLTRWVLIQQGLPVPPPRPTITRRI
jgi:hypothetical protein